MADRTIVAPAGWRAPPAGPVRLRFADEGPSLFWLAFRGVVLTVLTLGLYRFWMTTQLRRYYWSQVRIEGDPLEYTGTGLEKLLGFFLAVIVLAVYLGLVNLGLTFVGLSMFDGNPAALQLSLLAALPLYFYAQYRAYGYLLSRTRWRGIRLGLESGAGGFVLRALGWGLLAGLTAGLLYPLMQFKLARYITNRSLLGDQRFQQGGGWTGLIGAWLLIYAAAIAIGVAIYFTAASGGGAVLALALTLTYVALFVAIIRYGTVAFCYLWRHRTLGDTGFDNDMRWGRVALIYVFGTLGTVLAVAAIAAVLIGGIGLALIGGLGGLTQVQSDLAETMQYGGVAQQAPILIGAVVAYLLLIALFVPFQHVLVLRPIARMQVQGMTVANPAALARARQRAHDAQTDAGGFADALGVDAGAGF